MHTKFVLFTALSLSLVTVIYGSSASEVCAEPVRGDSSCTGNSDSTMCCWEEHDSEDPEGTSKTVCQTCNRVGPGTWECDDPVQDRAGILPENIKDALETAIQDSPNTTKGLTDVLNDFPLAVAEEDNNTDTEVPTKIPGKPKFNDFTLLNNDTKPAEDLGGVQDQDDEDDNKDTKIPEDFGGLQDEDQGPTINPETP